MSEKIQPGDTISVNYTGKFENGDVFDSSEESEPLKFTVGSGQLIKGFDDAVVNMSLGDKKTVTIAPADAYGERSEELMIDIPKSSFPEDMSVKIGMMLQLTNQMGHPIPAMVEEILEEVIKVDANHPLAGKMLVFDIEIAETGLEPDAHCDECDEDGSCGSCGCGCDG